MLSEVHSTIKSSFPTFPLDAACEIAGSQQNSISLSLLYLSWKLHLFTAEKLPMESKNPKVEDSITLYEHRSIELSMQL